MNKIVDLSCNCGSVKGTLKIVEGSFFHVLCLCCDCQSFASYLENEDKILDDNGGTELFQTYPSYMEITEGNEFIGCVQLSKNGLYRWHTTCCNMPLANTMISPNIPFVGVSVKLMNFDNNQEKDEVLGPVLMKAFGKYARGPMPADAYNKFPISFLPKIIGFMIKGMLSKKACQSPFFSNGEPVVKAKVL